jgi:glucose dehydrogenase
MRLFTTSHITSAFLAIALSLPVAAWAQTTTAPAAGGPRENVEQRIADMHATLGITGAQEAQWNDFAQVMLDNAQAMDAVLSKSASNSATQTADEILQGYTAITQQHAQNVQKLSTAFHTLYASLTADQKKAADDMFRASAARRGEKQGG